MKNRLLNFLLRNLFNALTTNEIVATHPKTHELFIDGKRVTEQELRTLQAEIKAIESSRVWTLVFNTTKNIAEEKIFKKSVDMDDIRFGKAMLYNLSLQKSIVDVIKHYRFKNNSQSDIAIAERMIQ